MKKLLILCLALVVLFCFAACKEAEDTTTPQGTTTKPAGSEQIKPPTTNAAADPSHAHDYAQEMTVPTCTEKGYITYTCVCGDSYTFDCAEPLGHSYTPSVTAPTCTEKGYTTYTCTCGDSYIGDETPVTHSYDKDGLCTSCSKKISVGLEYTRIGDVVGGYYRVTGIGSCWDIDIVIPEEHNGLPVREISSYAFQDQINFRSITIPDSITSIGQDAFSGCSSLESVYITDIAAWCNISFAGVAFNYYFNLYVNGELANNIEIPDGVTIIGDFAFYACGGLTNIIIPDSVIRIGTKAFAYTGLTNILIPNSTTYISYGIFCGCSSLESITLPDVDDIYGGSLGALFTHSLQFSRNYQVPDTLKTVVLTSGTRIDDEMFQDCTSLESITIPSSVNEIEKDAFKGCSNLHTVHIDDLTAWCRISFGNRWSSPMSNGADLYLNLEKVTEVTIPDNILNLTYAFAGCTSLKEVTIPRNVTSIGEKAFYGCKNLTTIRYMGTKEKWDAVYKDPKWNENTGNYTILCIDAEIPKEKTN